MQYSTGVLGVGSESPRAVTEQCEFLQYRRTRFEEKHFLAKRVKDEGVVFAGFAGWVGEVAPLGASWLSRISMKRLQWQALVWPS